MLGAVKLNTNADYGKNKYFHNNIGLDGSGSFSLSDGIGFGKNVIIFGVDMSSSVNVNNKKIYLGSW